MSLKRYSIWDKESTVVTPSGEVFTAEQWMERYPVATLPNSVIVGSTGLINGGFFGEISQMKEVYASAGCDFSNRTTNEEILEAIEAFEDAQNTPTDESTAEERIASALETQVMLSMETVNDDDPDEE